SFAISRSFWRLYLMTLGWATPGSGVAQNPELLADIIAGLDWMVEHYYREDGEIIGNWYEWQISGPMPFNDAVMLLYDELAAERIGAYTRAVANFTPEPSGTAANRALTATVVVGRGALAGDEGAVLSAVDGIGPVLEYAEQGDGFYRDGSFIQHEVYPYLGAYGASILEALVPIFTIVANTPWKVPADRASIVYEWLDNAFDPVIWNGALMDMVSGRTIARWDQHEHYHGHYVAGAALGLVAGAPEDRREKLRSMLKEWLVGDGYDDPTPKHNVPILLKARALVGDSSVERRGPLELSVVRANEDRIVHRRASWAVGIAMRSSRIANFEAINDENLRGWLTADGAVYLYDPEAAQFMEDFWATVDHHRIPGTTVEVRDRAPGEADRTLSPEAWAGGATLDRRYTAGGMRLAAQGGSLTAKKSWFCFDDEVVALGADITAGDGRTIETVVENRRLGESGTEAVHVDGTVQVADLGSGTTVRRARWMHLEGTGGYVFARPTELRLLREARTGRWSDVNQNPNWARDDPITRNYLTAWLDHGTDPAGATHAYVLLPGASPRATARYSARPSVEVLANDAAVQAARHREAGVLAANFWAPGRVSFVRTTGTGAVVVRRKGRALDLAVADPTRAAAVSTITVAARAERVIAADDGLRVVDLDPLTIEVDLAAAAGATRTLRVRL
ncbi:MAG TPA: polysaccharide lyase 8 family protein, partial [Actinopolymorphaceae bacterium]